MADVLIIETGNGGDLVLRGNDLVIVQGVENQPYLHMFGGDAGWWGNDLISRPEFQWTSETTAALSASALTSDGRIQIEQAIIDDMKPFEKRYAVKVTVSVVISGPDRLSIQVTINGEMKEYTFTPDKLFKTYSV